MLLHTCFATRVPATACMRRTGIAICRPQIGTPSGCQLLKQRPTLGSLCSTFSGLTLRQGPATSARRLSFVVQANGKKCLGCTKQGTRRVRTRTSGFRARTATKGGKKVLKARRKKGRKQICPAHEYKKWSFLPGRTALPS